MGPIYHVQLWHSVWKSQKKSLIQHCERSELHLHYSNPFWRVFENLKVEVNSVTRQVNFNRTKVDGKCQIFYPALSGSSLRSILGKLFKVEIDFAIVAIEEFCRQKVRDLCEGSHYSCARMRRGAECILKVRASGQARVEMARANKRWGQQMVSRLF